MCKAIGVLRPLLAALCTLPLLVHGISTPYHVGKLKLGADVHVHRESVQVRLLKDGHFVDLQHSLRRRSAQNTQSLRPLRGGGAASSGWIASKSALGKNRVPLSLKLMVLFCGGAWFSACLQALFSVTKLALVPGGVRFLSDRSSHGLPGVLLFVAFAVSLAFMQAAKLVRILRAKGLEEIRTTLWLQALFNLVFVWRCGWRPSASVLDMQWRDLIILAETNAMIFYFALYWSRKPWRATGRSLR